MSKKITLADVLELSAAERILLAQDLWDSVVEEPEAWSLSESQRAALDRRLDAYRQSPASDRD